MRCGTRREKKIKIYIYLLSVFFYARKHVVLLLLLLLSCYLYTKDSENILQYYSFLCIKVKYHHSNYNGTECFYVFIYGSS